MAEQEDDTRGSEFVTLAKATEGSSAAGRMAAPDWCLRGASMQMLDAGMHDLCVRFMSVGGG